MNTVQPNSSHGGRLAQPIARRARLILLLCVVGALCMPLSLSLNGVDGTMAWLVDLAANWQWLYLTFGLVCTATLLVCRRSRALALASTACIATTTVWPLWPLTQNGHTAHPAIATGLSIVSANLHHDNTDADALRAWIRSLGVDLVIVQEVTPDTAAQLDKWADYPCRVITPRFDPFGLAILSRYPLLDTESLQADGQPLHYRTIVDWNGTHIALAAIHPMPPLDATFHALRAALVEQEAAWLARTGLPALLVGDLNSTPWSVAMQQMTTLGLRRASGLTPTWPARVPILPLDHILANAAWAPLSADVGPEIGSDHLPVHAVIVLGTH